MKTKEQRTITVSIDTDSIDPEQYWRLYATISSAVTLAVSKQSRNDPKMGVRGTAATYYIYSDDPTGQVEDDVIFALATGEATVEAVAT